MTLQLNTIKRIQTLFTAELQKEVIDSLTNECAKGIRPNNHEELERIRIAILKISEGDINKFYKAIEWSQIDWRDVLVAAGFGNDLNAHKVWISNNKDS